MKRHISNASTTYAHAAQVNASRSMGTLEDIWQNYKSHILIGSAIAGAIYFMSKKDISANPADATIEQANLVLGHIDEFAADHPSTEVARVLHNIEKKFPSMSQRVRAARARVL
jgi:hypothetical protein